MDTRLLAVRAGLIPFFLLWHPLEAQELRDENGVPFIEGRGEAVVTAEATHAEVDVGVVTRDATAQGAADANARSVTSVLEELRELLGTDARLSTTRYTLAPIYRSVRTDAELELEGFTATSTIRVSAIPVGDAGKILDAATRSGANVIQRLEFKVEDERPLRLQALRQAARDARERIEALAEELGLEVVRILSVFDTELTVARPFPRGGAVQAERARVSTPVEPSTIEVRATATVRVEVR